MFRTVINTQTPRRLATAALAALLAAVLACGGGEETPSPQAPGDGEPAASNALKIGFIMPLSGPLAAYGESCRAGADLAVEEINAAGGVGGRPLEVVTENNEGDPTKSAEAFRKLEGLNKVLAVVGPITSTNALAIARDAQSKGVPFLTPVATNDKVTQAGDFVFRACPTDSFQGRALAEFARNDLGLASVVSVQDTKSDYSVGLCRTFNETFESLGGAVAPMVSYKGGDTDFTPQLRAIRESGAAGVFMPGYPPEVPLFVNQAASMGLEATLIGADGWDNNDLILNAGAKLDGSYFSAFFATDRPTPEVQHFMQLCADAGIENPGSFEAMGYDSVALVAEAIRNADLAAAADLAAKRRALRDGLLGIQDFDVVTGTVTMRPSGDPARSLMILKYEAAAAGLVGKTFVKSVAP